MVIELGSAEGHTTLHLARHAAQVAAIDHAAPCIERARARCAKHDNILWLTLDAFDTDQIIKSAPRADLVFVDLGGSTWASLALRAAEIYHHLYQPRAIVIRNVALNDFAAAVTSCETDARPGHWRS
jgi:predicted O-methyltransferase YrrM